MFLLHAVEMLDTFSSGTWSGNKKGSGKRQRYPFKQFAAFVRELVFCMITVISWHELDAVG